MECCDRKDFIAMTMCANFDLRPTGFRLFEVKDDFSYSWNFVAVE